MGLRLGLRMTEPEFSWRAGNDREGRRPPPTDVWRRFVIDPDDRYVTYFLSPQNTIAIEILALWLLFLKIKIFI